MKKIYLFLLGTVFFCCESFAQTYTVPIQGPGFDNGNTFAANGWTVVNSPGGNDWVVGTTTFHSAPNSAYISIDGNANKYSYDNTKAHISHFYQKITIPANAMNISFSFQLLGNNELDGNLNMHDGLQVFADTSLTPPVADVMPGGKAEQVFFQFSPNGSYTGQTATLDALGVAGKSFLLIFTWLNDGDGLGSGPPASVDDASLSYCLQSSKFNVTGGGAYCTGSSGVGVGLAGSTTGISYQLYNNGSPVGSPVIGTGSALDFGPQTAVGTYTVAGSSTCIVGTYTFPMSGSATVTKNSLPVATAGSNAPICYGSTLNLTSGGGTSYKWTGPNGYSSTLQNPTIPNFSSTDTGTYTVTVTANACSAPATTRVSVTGGVATGGVLNGLSVCKGGNGKLTLSANSNNPQYWQSTTDTITGTWTHIDSTGNTLTLSNITAQAFYRAVVSDGCNTSNSSIATVGIHGLWTGSIGSNWNDTGNWSDGKLPSTSCPTVEIPVVATNNYPVLSTGPIATIINLQIDANTSLAVQGDTLQIAGNISNSGIFNVKSGSIEFNGTSPQSISGNIFDTHTIQNLIVSNASGLSVSDPGDTLNISGTLSFGNASGKLSTGNNITLLSTSGGTANLGVMKNGNTISGEVTVNRYINTG
ncbi:MAG: PKD domain-containing protein, partial [Ginsengibacter sp.]